MAVARSLTEAEIEGRENVMHALDALRHTVPGFELLAGQAYTVYPHEP